MLNSVFFISEKAVWLHYVMQRGSKMCQVLLENAKKLKGIQNKKAVQALWQPLHQQNNNISFHYFQFVSPVMLLYGSYDCLPLAVANTGWVHTSVFFVLFFGALRGYYKAKLVSWRGMFSLKPEFSVSQRWPSFDLARSPW